jgi:hypothetical protein
MTSPSRVRYVYFMQRTQITQYSDLLYKIPKLELEVHSWTGGTSSLVLEVDLALCFVGCKSRSALSCKAVLPFPSLFQSVFSYLSLLKLESNKSAVGGGGGFVTQRERDRDRAISLRSCEMIPL